MQPTISIPHGWKYPRFNLGQHTEHRTGNYHRHQVLPKQQSSSSRIR